MSNKQETRQRILEAALSLFTARGIELTTTREIAATADCNEITLFRHFENKDGLVRAVISWYVPQQESPELESILTGDNLESDLFAATKLTLRFHKERETFFRFIFANIVQHPEQAGFIDEIQEPFLGALYQYLMPVLKGTGLDPAVVVHDFITPIAMRTVGRVFLGQEQLDEDSFARDHARLIAAGIQNLQIKKP